MNSPLVNVNNERVERLEFLLDVLEFQFASILSGFKFTIPVDLNRIYYIDRIKLVIYDIFDNTNAATIAFVNFEQFFVKTQLSFYLSNAAATNISNNLINTFNCVLTSGLNNPYLYEEPFIFDTSQGGLNSLTVKVTDNGSDPINITGFPMAHGVTWAIRGLLTLEGRSLDIATARKLIQSNTNQTQSGISNFEGNPDLEQFN